MQSLKIDLSKLTGATRFQSKSGIDHIAIPLAANGVYIGEKGLYLELTLRDNKDGGQKYGWDGYADVNLSKEQRDAGDKGPIVGNWKHIVGGRTQSPQKPQDDEYRRNAEDGEAPPF